MFKVTFKTLEKRYFKNLLKASIARNIWEDEIYFEILSKEDEFIK